MTRLRDYDVVVIGAGVLGTAVAARVAMTTASVCVLEEADDVAEGASKGNAGIVSSFYAAPNTIEAELIAASSPRWEDICSRLDVPFSRPGALTIAVDEEEAKQLPALRDQACAAGARADLLSGAEACELEPMITPDCRGAVHFPDEGLIDPMRLTCAYAELAVTNGAEIQFESPALRVEPTGPTMSLVTTSKGRFRARWVVNAAGVASGRISALAGGEQIDVWPRKGQYWILDRAFGDRLRMMVLPMPTARTRGIQVAPTTNGSVLLGPDAHDVLDADDKGTDRDSLAAVFEQARRLVPSISQCYAIKSYAANRAASEETVKVRPDTQVPNLIHVANRSTGVSASPATADRVLEILRSGGLECEDRADRVNALPKVRRLLFDSNPETLIDLDSRYSQVVCVCEQVTAAEIARALSCPVPARSIEGVRKRTRATAGRCQGSVCMAGVAFLCSLHTGQSADRIRHGPGLATIGVASVD